MPLPAVRRPRRSARPAAAPVPAAAARVAGLFGLVGLVGAAASAAAPAPPRASAAVAAVALAAPDHSAAVPTLPEVVRTVDRSLVHVEASARYGSGFLFRDGRTVVTAAHVLGELPVGGEVMLRPVVVGEDGLTELGPAFAASLQAVHAELDLAVLLAADPPAGVRPIAPAPAGPMLARGTEVLVHGFPGPMSPTLSRGVVSAHRRDFTDGATYYLLDAAIGAGSSGGPVTDRTGRLVAIATAVHAADDVTDFAWTYALPLAAIEAMVPAGGAAAIEPPATVAALVERIRLAADDAARVERLGAVLDELLATRATVGRFAADLDAVMAEAVGLVRPRAADDVRRLLELVLEFEGRVARRAVRWSLAGAEVDADAAVRLDGLDRRVASWARELAADGLRRAATDRRAEWERAVLEPVATVLEELAAAAADACTVAADLRTTDELGLRGLDREAVIEALGRLAHLEAMVLALHDAPPIDPGDGDVLSAERWAVVRRYAEAALAATDAWDALPPACRGDDLDDDVDYTSPETIRASLAAAGWREVEPPRPPIALAPLASETFELDLAALGASAFRLMGVSSDGQDVDLLLLAPDGSPHDEDFAIDGFPIVGGDASFGTGPWRVEAHSATDRPTTMRLELWVR